MNLQFRFPELTENVENGDTVSVLVEIPRPYAGRIAKIDLAKRDSVNVGQTLLTPQSEAEAPDEQPTTGKPLAPAGSWAKCLIIFNRGEAAVGRAMLTPATNHKPT